MRRVFTFIRQRVVSLGLAAMLAKAAFNTALGAATYASGHHLFALACWAGALAWVAASAALLVVRSRRPSA